MTKLLSICIPTYNRDTRVKKTLDILFSIIKEIDNPSIEIIVSDNCSEDKTQTILKSYKNELTIYKQERNLGYDGNVKFLYSVATSKYIFMLSDDDILNSQFIELYDIISENQDVDCFCANFYNGDKAATHLEKFSSTIITLEEFGTNFYSPFVFLSGFVLRNNKIDYSQIWENTYATQMDVALSILNPKSKIYLFKDFLVQRVIPNVGDETGCNIMTNVWKIPLGFLKVQRKHERKMGIKLPFLMEAIGVTNFIRQFSGNNKVSLAIKAQNTLKIVSALQWQYKLRLVIIPWYYMYRIIEKSSSK